MSKHTKGPWHVGCGNGEGSVFSPDGRMRLEAGGSTLYPICTVTRGWESVEDEANARLIAAAPELLAVCKKLVERGAVIATTGLGDELESAIAKAEGR